MKKSLKTLSVLVPSVIGASALATTAACVLTNQDKQKNLLATNNSSTTKENSVVNRPSTYITIQYQKGNYPACVFEGATTEKVKSDRPFYTVSRPTATLKNYEFACWQRQDSEGQWIPVLETDTFSQDTILTPLFQQIVMDKTITFSPGETGAELVGATEVYIKTGAQFNTVNTPEVVKAGFKCDYWVNEQGEQILPTTRFYQNAVLTPHLIIDGRQIHIHGEDEMALGTKQQFAVVTEPEGITVVWSVAPATTNPGAATIDPLTGEMKATSCGNVIVTATAVDDQSLKCEFNVLIQEPWIAHEGFFTKISNVWYQIDHYDLCDDQPITLVNVVTEEQTEIARADFGANGAHPIYVGEDATYVPSYFCWGCENFNSDIIFPEKSRCVVIGVEFMSGCEAFNRPLTLPEKTRIICTDFMYGCTGFNSTITLPDDLVEIDDNFMSGCTSFVGTDFALPMNLYWLGDSFLFGCTSFHNFLSLPSSLSHIGKIFMHNCDAMGGATIAIDCAVSVFYDANPELLLSTRNESSDAYQKGIYISGTNGNEFREKFGPLTGPDNFRNLKSGAGEIHPVEWPTSFHVGETINLTVDATENIKDRLVWFLRKDAPADAEMVMVSTTEANITAITPGQIVVYIQVGDPREEGTPTVAQLITILA